MQRTKLIELQWMDSEALWTPNVCTKLQSFYLFHQNIIKRIVLSATTQHNTAINTILTFVLNSVTYPHMKIIIARDVRIKDVKFEVQYWFNTTNIAEDRQNVRQCVIFRYTCWLFKIKYSPKQYITGNTVYDYSEMHCLFNL